VNFIDWHARLLRNEKGKVLPCYDNAAMLLENSPEWAGVIGLNEFTGAVHVRKHPPAPVTAPVGKELEDYFDTEVTRWLERQGVMAKPSIVHKPPGKKPSEYFLKRTADIDFSVIRECRTASPDATVSDKVRAS
jgi:hypothetical protein